MTSSERKAARAPWNKGKLVGQKAALKLKDVWAIRIRLQIEKRVRELAPVDLGIDSKLRACDLVALRVRDVCQGDRVSARAIGDCPGHNGRLAPRRANELALGASASAFQSPACKPCLTINAN